MLSENIVNNVTYKDFIAILPNQKIILDYKSKTSDFGGKNIRVESSYKNRMYDEREVNLVFTIVDEKITHIIFGLNMFDSKEDIKHEMDCYDI